jgi:hypothetical protein
MKKISENLYTTLYNTITLTEVLGDEDLDRPLQDLDTGDTYTLREILKQLSEAVEEGVIE